MSTGHDSWSRRSFVNGLALGGAATLSGLRPAAAEPPPEITRIRLPQTPAMCEAPQYVVRDLLKAEGFTAVEYVKLNILDPGARSLEHLLRSGDVDVGFNFAAPVLVNIDAGDPIRLLAGI